MGQDASKNFDIELDGQILTHETLAGPPEDGFRRMNYVLPAGVSGKFHLRFVTCNSELAVFECRTLRPAGAVA